MAKKTILKGFSKLSQEEKTELVSRHFKEAELAKSTFQSFKHHDDYIQEVLSDISENTISNYPLPYNVAPNFLINDKMYIVPMVIEESSVVAAASSAARFWAERGGFRARVISNRKNGQVHFRYTGDKEALVRVFPHLETYLRQHLMPLTRNMEQRGGGVRKLKLKDLSHQLDDYYQLHVTFDTRDAMGANFINSCLEELSQGANDFFETTEGFDAEDYEPLMAILSNYNEECLCEVSVSCPVSSLEEATRDLPAALFADRFTMAVRIAEADIHRATTHNKGIMNGVDAVILATGNDFRAIEAGAHAYAARSGRYRSLSHVDITDNTFTFSLTMPLALGTVGGLTRLHPLAAKSLELLDNPSAEELMMIAAAAGLANNFAAVRSLTTTGIQAGHMRMHLSNITKQLLASPEETEQIKVHFQDKKVSYQAVAGFLENLRGRI